MSGVGCPLNTVNKCFSHWMMNKAASANGHAE